MSWDILILNAEGAPARATDEWENTRPMGNADDVREQISACLPINWNDPEWGVLEGDGYSIEFNFQLAGEVDSFMLHVRGGRDPVSAIGYMCKTNNWVALDCSTGAFMDFADESNDSWKGFQAYRDRVFEEEDDAAARKDMVDLMLALQRFSKLMIAEHGAFHPHGGVVDSCGMRRAVVAFDSIRWGDTKNGDTENEIDMLVKELREGAESGQYRAAGYAFDVNMAATEAQYATRAIAMKIEHRYGFSSEVFIPYTLNSGEPPTYGEMLDQNVDPVIFQSDASGGVEPIDRSHSVRKSDSDSRELGLERDSVASGYHIALVISLETKEAEWDLDGVEKKLPKIRGILNVHRAEGRTGIVALFKFGKETIIVYAGETNLMMGPLCDASFQLALEIQKRFKVPLKATGGKPSFTVPLQGIGSIEELKRIIEEQVYKKTGQRYRFPDDFGFVSDSASESDARTFAHYWSRVHEICSRWFRKLRQ